MVYNIRLFNPNDTDFTTNGLGCLHEASVCEVTEERNGMFELTLSYPASGHLYSKINVGSIIVCKSNPFSSNQAFRVYSISKPIRGIVKFNAAHISYDLSNYAVRTPIREGDSAVSIKTAMDDIFENIIMPDGARSFSYTLMSPLSDYNRATFNYILPATAKSILGGSEGSILDQYHVEYEFDNYNVKIYNNDRGANNAVSIRYGKNLTGLTYSEDISEAYTYYYPYFYNETVGVLTVEGATVDGHYYDSPIIPLVENPEYVKVLMLDVSSDFQIAPYGRRVPGEILRCAAIKLKEKDYTSRNISVDISFVQLGNSKEYEKLKDIESIKLCDTINCYNEDVGVDFTAKCVKTVYDALTDKYTSISLGYSKLNLIETFVKQDANARSNKNTALNAMTAGNTAQTAAEAAQSTANTASSKADDAQTAAEAAQSTANGAQTTATNAQNTATAAQTTANTASSKADAAQTTANSAQNGVNALNSLFSDVSGHSYVTLKKNTAGTAIEEILVANSPNYTASNTHLWRWNSEGLAYTNGGYNSSNYTVGMNMNGEIFAKHANITDSMEIKDTENNTIFKADTTNKLVTIGKFNINEDGLIYEYVDSEDPSITKNISIDPYAINFSKTEHAGDDPIFDITDSTSITPQGILLTQLRLIGSHKLELTDKHASLTYNDDSGIYLELPSQQGPTFRIGSSDDGPAPNAFSISYERVTENKAYLTLNGQTISGIATTIENSNSSVPTSALLYSVKNQIPTVIDNHTSTSTTAALSANQGKVLYDLIQSGGTEIIDNLTSTSTTAALSANQGRVLKGLIPTKTSQLTNDSGFITGSALGGYVPTTRKINGYSLSSDVSLTAIDISGLAIVATSGSYNDLSNKPTIPTVNDGTITIKMNGTTKGSFGVNTPNPIEVDLGTVITSLPTASTTTAGITKVGASGGAAAYSHTHTKSQITDFPTDLVTYYGTVTPSNLAMFGADGSVIGDSGLSADNIQSKITSTNKLSASLVSGLATVATSGSYNDLSNKPFIPANTSDLVNDSHYITSSALSDYVPTARTVNSKALSSDIKLTALDINMDGTEGSITISGAYDVLSNNKQDKITSTNKLPYSLISGTPTLATVATSGSYNDLSNKPTIPTVNDATITIKMNNASKGTFTTNAGTAKTIDLGTVITSLPAASTTTAGITKVGASGGAAAYSHTHKENDIYGANSVSGNVTPLDAAAYFEFNANRLAYIPADDITVEKSTDGGSTWSDYGATNGQKINLTTTPSGQTFYTGGVSSNAASNYQLRITLTANSFYFRLSKFLIFISTAGVTGASAHMEEATIGTPDTFTTIGDYAISGYSGWNSIPYNVSFGGYSHQTSQIKKIRFTFSYSGKSASSPNAQLRISKIRALGTTVWTSPSTMASSGHLYNFDASKNAIFPADVSATSFTENGTALSDKYAANSHTHTISQITNFPTDLVTYSGTTTPLHIAQFGADGSIITDSGLSSDNIQSKITSSNKLASSLISGLATVATSGSYNDLSDKPTGITGAGVYYGVCSTAAATAAKTVTLSRGDGFTLTTGVTVFIKFTAANTAANPTLNVNGTGAKALMQYGTTAMSTNAQSTGWRANAIVALTYDGTNWIRTHWENGVLYYTSIYSTTAAATAAKVGVVHGNFSLDAGKNFQVLMYYANTSKTALTLNIASTGAKPIYINGQPSSATNYTLPAGEYLVYYDGSNYYFETDGTIRTKKVIADNLPMVLTLSGDGDVITDNDFANYYTNPNPAHVIYHSGQRQYYYLQTISTGTNYNVYYVCPSSSTSYATRDTIEITPTGYWSLWA